MFVIMIRMNDQPSHLDFWEKKKKTVFVPVLMPVEFSFWGISHTEHQTLNDAFFKKSVITLERFIRL